MGEVLRSIVNSPAFSIAGFAIGLIGLVATWRSTRQKRPTYQVQTAVLVEGEQAGLDGLAFTYKGQPQTRISISRVAFWNAGRETIYSTDIASADPLRIHVAGANILDVKLIAVSKDSNLFAVRPTAGARDISLSFDFADHKDFAVIQIVHDGTLDTRIELHGHVKAVRQIRRNVDPASPFDQKQTRWMLQYMLNPTFTQWSAVLLTVAILASAAWRLWNGDYAWYVWVTLALGLLFSLATFVMFRQRAPLPLTARLIMTLVPTSQRPDPKR